MTLTAMKRLPSCVRVIFHDGDHYEPRLLRSRLYAPLATVLGIINKARKHHFQRPGQVVLTYLFG